MTELDRALSQLDFIHTRMAAGTRFRGFAPAAVAGTGALAVVVALVETRWPAIAGGGGGGFVWTWTAVAVVAASIVAFEGLGRTRRLHGRMADAMIGGTLRLLLPFGAAGAAITLVIARAAPDAIWVLPGLWQMLVALLGFCAIGTLPRAIAWPACWYFACATIVLLAAARTDAPAPWMMGVPFGIGQSLVAIILHRAAGDTDG